MVFSPHEIEWTAEKVRRFWDHSASDMSNLYFSKMVGHSVVAYVSRRITIGTALDLGCGTGGLIEHLLARRLMAFGADQSADSVAAVNSRLAGKVGFQGAYVGIDHVPAVDTVFMLEVIEHMDDEALGSALTDAKRLLKPGGHLVLTTPNEEKLVASRRICPECGCMFHAMQHIRSWSAETLSDYMAASGFQEVSCEGTLFSAHHSLKGSIDRLRYRRRHKPHLIYIGQPV